jgi:ABC-type transporter Mla MlaB component
VSTWGDRSRSTRRRRCWKRASELIDELGDKQRVQIDNSAVEVIDGACMALLVHLRGELKIRHVHCEFTGGSPVVRAIVDLYGGRRRPRVRRRRRPHNAVEQVGQATVELFRECRSVLEFLTAKESNGGEVGEAEEWRDTGSGTGADSAAMLELRCGDLFQRRTPVRAGGRLVARRPRGPLRGGGHDQSGARARAMGGGLLGSPRRWSSSTMSSGVARGEPRLVEQELGHGLVPFPLPPGSGRSF